MPTWVGVGREVEELLTPAFLIFFRIWILLLKPGLLIGPLKGHWGTQKIPKRLTARAVKPLSVPKVLFCFAIYLEPWQC